MKKFNHTMNHRADEAFMDRMCREGWAATRLVEGIWSFEPCRPGQYFYRVAYLRYKSGAEVEELKETLAARGIEFVSRYSFWAIFRSAHDFELYTPEEELALCEQICRPTPIGAALSWIAFFRMAALAVKISAWMWLPGALVAVYAAMCTCLGISYTRLIRRLKEDSRRE